MKHDNDVGNIYKPIEPVVATTESMEILTGIMDPWEWQGLEQAALHEHTGDPDKAEQYRSLIGYGGLDSR